MRIESDTSHSRKKCHQLYYFICDKDNNAYKNHIWSYVKKKYLCAKRKSHICILHPLENFRLRANLAISFGGNTWLVIVLFKKDCMAADLRQRWRKITWGIIKSESSYRDSRGVFVREYYENLCMQLFMRVCPTILINKKGLVPN